MGGGFDSSPFGNDEEMKLRRNIELLGGIERTIPSIRCSYYS